MDQLRISLVQSHLHWENPVANREQFTEKLAGLSGITDLIVLPEMFTTGFTMNAQPHAETMTGATADWMREQAKNTQAAIIGSVIIEEAGSFYNRCIFVDSKGVLQYYDKKHTFTLAGEHRTYKSGNHHTIIEYKGWRLCPLVCYDLRFPVWARNTHNYDVLLYVANWPKKRIAAWDALLKARAIENMAYCVGVNRVGLDGNGYEYVGHSGVYDVLGETITASTHLETEWIDTVILDKKHITTLREQLLFLGDQDSFRLE